MTLVLLAFGCMVLIVGSPLNIPDVYDGRHVKLVCVHALKINSTATL